MTAAVSASQENGSTVASNNPYRIFVGNLSYNITTPKLIEFFGKAGKVYAYRLSRVDAVPVMRYGRPAGYGFVTFEAEEAVEKACALKDQELDGRPINVERATPQGERSSTGRRGGRGRGRGRRARGQRRRSGPPTGEPSKTVLFVGNLPFNVVDEDLVNIFKDFGVDSAHVVRRFNGASRGFGFVTLKSETKHAEALEKMTEVYCDERRLIIRAALSTDGRQGGEPHHEVVVKEDKA